MRDELETWEAWAEYCQPSEDVTSSPAVVMHWYNEILEQIIRDHPDEKMVEAVAAILTVAVMVRDRREP